jgi:hypothetical protein
MRQVIQPAFGVVDDDGDTVADLERTLCRRFGADYRIFAERSANRALSVLERLRDERHPGRRGDRGPVDAGDVRLDFSGRSREIHPSARRALLFDAYDRSADESICRGMALGGSTRGSGNRGNRPNTSCMRASVSCSRNG